MSKYGKREDINPIIEKEVIEEIDQVDESKISSVCSSKNDSLLKFNNNRTLYFTLVHFSFFSEPETLMAIVPRK